ncbi:MAG: S1 family peptidase [Actinomycetota bacterium]|nr:S1 family peptidase [Actinomycetota bacterium]
MGGRERRRHLRRCLGNPKGDDGGSFTSDLDRADSALRKVVKAPAKLEVVGVPRSLGDLLGIQSRIDRDVASLKQEGISVTGTGIVTDINRVQVRVRGLTPAVRAALTSRYGDALRLVEGDYPRPAHKDPGLFPWTGGMHTTGPCLSQDCLLADCTSAFVVYRFISGVKFFYLLTAGHCFEAYGKVTVHGLSIGTVEQRVWLPYSNADVEKIAFTQPLNSWPYTYTTGTTEEVLTSVAPNQVLGQSVCKSGITTDQTCSWTVSAIHSTEHLCLDWPNCQVIMTQVDQVEATRSNPGVDFGDSGGPVYMRTSYGLQGHGIVSAQADGGRLLIYTFLLNALNVTGTDLCTNATC